MNNCPDKLEPLSDTDMLLFIRLTLQDVICGVISMGDTLIDVNAVQKALKYAEILKERQ
jgi:hypothetical protein|tara:strand:- start:1916 stop:2092 length:177 start_codon:yes stop_codon:yes gene_type:complete